LEFPGKSFLANEFGGWFSNEDPMLRKDAFWAGGKPALAREPNRAYTEGMIPVKPPHPLKGEGISFLFQYVCPLPWWERVG